MSASVRDQFQAAASNVDELGDIDQAITSAVQRRHRSLAVTAAAGVTSVAIVAAVFFGTGPGDSQSEPLRPPTPTPSLTSDVDGWPDTTRNAPGVYSLDGGICGLNDGSSCSFGAMHNGHGSSGVVIKIDLDANADSDEVDPGEGVDIKIDRDANGASDEVDPGEGTTDIGTSVVVAGYEGIYRRIDARHEMWVVNIEGSTVAIKLRAGSDTSPADLAEAHAIIDSMRTGPAVSTTNNLGVSLMFTITTNDWDSG